MGREARVGGTTAAVNLMVRSRFHVVLSKSVRAQHPGKHVNSPGRTVQSPLTALLTLNVYSFFNPTHRTRSARLAYLPSYS